MFSTVLVSLILFVLVLFSLCLFWAFIHSSCKKLVLINLNAVIKIYSKLWELCMHPDYDYFVYIFHQLPKNTNSSHKPVFFLGITTLFLFSLLLCGSRVLKKKTHQIFWFEISLQQVSRWKETYFAIRKVLQNFEGHDHWH